MYVKTTSIIFCWDSLFFIFICIILGNDWNGIQWIDSLSLTRTLTILQLSFVVFVFWFSHLPFSPIPEFSSYELPVNWNDPILEGGQPQLESGSSVTVSGCARFQRRPVISPECRMPHYRWNRLDWFHRMPHLHYQNKVRIIIKKKKNV